MKKVNFKALDWSEYKGYRYESDKNDKVCIFDPYMAYVAAVDSVEQADALVDNMLTESSTKRSSKPCKRS